MALTVTITNAGRAELINAQNTGTNAAVINSIGVSSVHAAGDLKLLTALPNERKRLNTIGGEVVADDVIHVTINDTTADTYTLRAFGLYFDSGTLFAVCTSVDPIMEKAAAAMLLQAVDITLTTLDTASIEFGGTGFTNPPATTERMGVVELATVDETIAGTDAVRAVTPYGLARALVSWAQNFAAKVHGHVIADIAGLSDSLASKANRNHVHGADDVNSGVFHIDRIPKLAISWINGLADQLAGLAAKDHKHTASDITSGQLHLDRLPAIPQSKVSGLVDAIATLTTAVAAKAEAALSVVMRGSLGSVDLNTVLTPGGYRQAANANAQLQLNYPITNDGGSLLVVNPSTDTGYQTYHSRTTNRMWTRPFLAGNFYPWAEHWTSANLPDPAQVGSFNTFTTYQAIETSNALPLRLSSSAASGTQLQLNNSNGGAVQRYFGITPDGELVFGASLTAANNRLIYHSGNLNPASFAPSNHIHDGLIVRQTYAPGTDLNSLTSSGIIGVHANPAANLNFPVISAGALEVFASAATRVYQRYTTSSTTAPDVYERTLLGTTWSPWRKVVMDDLASTYGARGLIEMATDAEAITGTDQERAINPYILKRRVDARAASNAETLAGSLTDKFITPSSLWAFAKSIGLNGYAQVPGTPLVIQWGRQTGAMSEGQRTVMLPIAFGGGCVAMLAIPWNSSPTADYYMQIVGRYLDRLVFMLNSASGSSGSAQGFDWLAIGFATGTPNPAYSSGGGGGGGGGGLPPGGGGEDPIIRPEV
ncbi:gp53-like domain-containing protein [Brevundimonas sp. NPDC055814]